MSPLLGTHPHSPNAVFLYWSGLITTKCASVNSSHCLSPSLLSPMWQRTFLSKVNSPCVCMWVDGGDRGRYRYGTPWGSGLHSYFQEITDPHRKLSTLAFFRKKIKSSHLLVEAGPRVLPGNSLSFSESRAVLM